MLSAVDAVSAEVMDDLNSGMLQVMSNQKKIEQETRQLQLQTAQFNKSPATLHCHILPPAPHHGSRLTSAAVRCMVQAGGSVGGELQCGE